MKVVTLEFHIGMDTSKDKLFIQKLFLKIMIGK